MSEENKKPVPAVMGILICSALIYINEGSFIAALPRYEAQWRELFRIIFGK